jgi:hypothetical protein
MASFDVLSFLEYYADRANVMSGGLRVPTAKWQNFYQVAQTLTTDAQVAGAYPYLAFDVDGYGSSSASSINDLTISVAATANIVDITDTAIDSDNLIIATLYIQDAGQDAFDGASAQMISRYIGSIDSAAINDIAISWKVNPAIDKMKPQIPTRKITADMLIRKVGQ